MVINSFFLYCFFLSFGQLIAQPKVEMYVDDTEMFVGDRTRLVIEISGKFSKLNEPQMVRSIQGVQILNSNPSVSSSTSVVNGVVSRSYSYLYFLKAVQNGTFTIPSISIRIEGKNYRTKPIKLKIYNRSKKANQTIEGRTANIYTEMELSDKSPFVGQQIEAKIILYVKKGLDVHQYTPDITWNAEGFWKEHLKLNNNRLRSSSVIVDGISYLKFHVHSIILFPTRSGSLTLPAYNLTVSMSQNRQNDPFSSFFSTFGGSVKDVSLSTKEITIEAKKIDYPWSNDVYFNGVVGQFSITRNINKTNLEVGETIELTTTFQGNGNLPFLSKPVYNFPSSFEVYEPTEDLKTNSASFPLSGQKTFHDVLVPRKKGTFTIPSIKLAVFNPNTNKPQIFILEPLTINVKERRFALSNNSSSLSDNSYLKQGELKTGLIQWNDIKPLYLYSSQPLVWVLFTLPLCLYVTGFYIHRYYTKIMKDEQFMRSKNAYYIASTLLDEVKEYSKRKDPKEGYYLIFKALTGFISDRLNLSRAGLSIKDYTDQLRENGLEEKHINTIETLLNTCDSISYASVFSLKSLSQDIELSYKLLEILKKEIIGSNR